MMKKLLSVFGLIFLGACSTTPSRPVSDHFDGKKFFNPHHRESHGFIEFLKMLKNYEPEMWPEKIENKHKPSLPASLAENQIAITFVNHATLLIQTKEMNILTDPVWSERASPFSFVGPKRARAPGIDFDSLPKIDLVLVSHNHYDHMDLATLQKLSRKFNPVILVPLGNKSFLEKQKIGNVSEMDWWESHMVGPYQITLGPAQHFSARGLFDRNDTLWGSFWIKAAGKDLFFGGDTGYAPHFAEIKTKLGSPDIAFLPIGAYEPNWFMKPVHMNPAEAVKAHQDLQSKQSIGIHFGTFQLTEEAVDEPILALKRALIAEKIKATDFVAPEEGQTIIYTL